MVMAAAISADGMWITPQSWAEPPPPPALSDAEVLATFFGEQSLGLYAMPAPVAAATAEQAEAANACLGTGLDFLSHGNEAAATLTDAEIASRYLGNAIDQGFATALAKDIATVDECFRPEDVHAMGPAVDYDDHLGPMPAFLSVMYHGGTAARPDIEEQRRMTAGNLAEDLVAMIRAGQGAAPDADAGVSRMVSSIMAVDPTLLTNVLAAAVEHGDKVAEVTDAAGRLKSVTIGRDWLAPVLDGMANGLGNIINLAANAPDNERVRRMMSEGTRMFASTFALAGRPAAPSSPIIHSRFADSPVAHRARHDWQERVGARQSRAIGVIVEQIDKTERLHNSGRSGAQVAAMLKETTQSLIECLARHGKKHDSLGAVIDGLMAGAGPRWAPAARAALAEVSPADIRRVDEAVNRRFQAQGRAEGVAFPDRPAPTGPTR